MAVDNDRRVFDAFKPSAGISPVSGWASGSPHRGQLLIVAAVAASGSLSWQRGQSEGRLGIESSPSKGALIGAFQGEAGLSVPSSKGADVLPHIVRPSNVDCQRSNAAEPRAVFKTPCFSGSRRSVQKSLPQAHPIFPVFFATLRRKASKITIFTPRPSCTGDSSRCKIGAPAWEQSQR